MTSCILTIIKNEHQYLDEWIQYHLNLGIDHIFIFEDIDSESHQNITNKYKEKVSLNSILSIIYDEDKINYLEYKKTKQINPQEIGIQAGIIYIKNNFNFDWCFIVDIDEFITLEDSTKSLKDVISMFNNYDAFIVSWECYGANTLIKKPDYSKNSVIDIFTEKIKGYLPIRKPEWNKKTCFNLNKYEDNFWHGNHTPSDECNFCNTIFKKDRDTLVYNQIYLRHYITKSWEEYYWKKTSRGYFMGFSRTLDAFFKMNPEMLYLKKSLIPYPSEYTETLVLLPYKQSKAQGDELTIAINAWKKFCKFKYRLVVIGQFDKDLPRKFPGVSFLRTDELDKKENQYNPHLDIMTKMMKANDIFGKHYPGFIYMTDDCYAIKPFTLQDILTIHYHEISFIGNKTKPTFFWKHNKWKTRELLDRENLPHINYTTHFPFYFDFNKLKEICDKYNMLEESYVIEDVYFNYFEHEAPVLDKPIRCGICSKKDYDENFQNAIDNSETKFIFNSVEGWSKELEEALKAIIEEKEQQ